MTGGELTAASFDPNARNEPGSPAARFPIPYGSDLIRVLAKGIDGYLTALHAGIDTVAKAVPPLASAFAFANVSYMPDASNAGLLNWPGMDPRSLSKVAQENLAPRMVINQRRLDIARYSVLSSHPWKPGWRIEMMDAKESPSASTKREIKEAESFIWNCSRDFSYDEARLRDASLLSPFSQFLQFFIDDTLTFDGWAVWTDCDRMNRVKSFAALPASHIRLANPMKGYKGDRNIFAAMLDEAGTPVKPFTRDELFWAVRNPRTAPSTMGYGWSEVEQAILLVQAFQGAIRLNSDTFQANAIPNAIMLLQGDYFNQDQIDLMMREWQNAKRGGSKVWGVPVLGVPEKGDIKIIPLNDVKGEDVRYRDHMNMMGGLYCVLSGFPPRRMGIFASGHTKDNSPLPDQSVDRQGVDDPGLPPLLNFAADRITAYLVAPSWPHLKCTFTNADPKTDAREYEAKKLARTWKESRAESDLPELAKLVSAELKPVAEIMELCPEDSAKAGVFQAVAVKMLEHKLGLEAAEEGLGPMVPSPGVATPGARMESKKDPAKSEAHGHPAGVRRDSAAEAKRAVAH